MNNYLLCVALATIAFPSIALAAPQSPMTSDQHQQMSGKDGCCPDKADSSKKDGESKDDCCKGMKCCDSMKPSDKAAAADRHAGHASTH